MHRPASTSICGGSLATCSARLAECQAFQDEGRYIAAWMAAQSEVKEESITDSYLYRLSRATTTIRYRSFSRWEEARRTGADWEWWFLLQHGALRLRVQAKKLRGGRNMRAEITRHNRHGGQMAMLMAAAHRDRAIPVYVFFSSPHCRPLACAAASGTHGAYVASAHAIQSLLTGGSAVRDSDVLLKSRPVACIACCLLRGAAREAQGQIANWVREFRADEVGDSIEEDGWHEIVPPYVNRILGSSDEEGGVRPGIEEGLPPDIQAVLVVDLKRADLAR